MLLQLISLLQYIFQILFLYFSYTWADGDKYVGYWKDNKRQGKGSFFPKNGKSEIQIWDNGEQQ